LKINKTTLIVFSLFVFSCGLLEKNTSNQKTIKSPISPIKKVNEQNISPTWLSLNSKMTIEKQGQYSKVNTSIRVKKDSIIWISLKAPLGLEVLRLMLTPDSVYLMSRLEKNYLVKPFKYIKQSIKSDINFFQLQEILFASPTINSKLLNVSPIEIDNQRKYRLSSINENYIINNKYRVEEMSFFESEDKNITIKFNDYSFFDKPKYFYPNKILINVEAEEIFSVNADITKVEFNKATSLSFKIPSSYVKID